MRPDREEKTFEVMVHTDRCRVCQQFVYRTPAQPYPVLLFPLPGGPDPTVCRLDLEGKPTRHEPLEEYLAAQKAKEAADEADSAG